MRIHLINPSDVSFGVAVITPRWLYVLASATPQAYGDPNLVDETLEAFDPEHRLARRRRRHRDSYRQRAPRLPDRPHRAGARRVCRLRRHSRDALSGRGARARRRACRRTRRRRPDLGQGHRRLRRTASGRAVRRRPYRRAVVLRRALGPAAEGQLHVRLRADRPRLPEALLLLLGLAHRRTGSADAERRGCRRRAQWSCASADSSSASWRTTTSIPSRSPTSRRRAGGRTRRTCSELEAIRKERFELMERLADLPDDMMPLYADHDGGRRRHRRSSRRCARRTSAARSSASSR